MKKNFFFIILPLLLAVVCFGIHFTFGQLTLTKDGLLHEPLFFVIPLGYLFLFIAFSAIITRIVVFFLQKKIKQKEEDKQNQ